MRARNDENENNLGILKMRSFRINCLIAVQCDGRRENLNMFFFLQSKLSSTPKFTYLTFLLNDGNAI